jgi:hypothetical protein
LNLDPFSLVGWRETGFLQQFLVEYDKYRKKPGFWDSLRGEKPGFCDNFWLSTRDIGRNPVSEILVPPKSRSQIISPSAYPHEDRAKLAALPKATKHLQSTVG